MDDSFEIIAAEFDSEFTVGDASSSRSEGKLIR